MWIVFYVEGCGASSAEYRVHLAQVKSLLVGFRECYLATSLGTRPSPACEGLAPRLLSHKTWSCAANLVVESLRVQSFVAY